MFPITHFPIDDAKVFITFRLKIAEAPLEIFDSDAVECLATGTKRNRIVLINRLSAASKRRLQKRQCGYR